MSLPVPPSSDVVAGADLDEIVAAAAGEDVVAGDAEPSEPPQIQLSPPSPVSTSSKRVPETCSMPISVSKPCEPVSWATPTMLRSTVTPAIAPVL